jgi:Tfp pilus assembly protein PilF
MSTSPDFSSAGSIWHVPFTRNPNFTGHERALESLAAAFRSDRPHARLQVVHGLAGIGKTQLALEYAYRHRDQYRIVWWLRADNPARLAQDVGLLAARLQLVNDAEAYDEARNALLRHLPNERDWLLIFDGADVPATIRPYLPDHGGHVLITSRNPNWGALGASSFHLRAWERAESVRFLLRRSGRSATVYPDPAASTLAQALGDHPLALEQAGAIIERRRISFSDYLTRFEDYWAELLRSGRSTGEYPDAVAMAWELSFREVDETSPEASALLKVLAYLAPEPLPRSFIREAAALAPPPLSHLGDKFPLDAAIAELLRHSLVEADEQSVSLHRLVAGLVRDRAPAEWRANWCGVALQFVHAAFPFDEEVQSSWPRTAPIVPHALAVSEHAERLRVDPGINGKLLNEVGQYLYRTGRFAEARSVLERALDQTTHAHGEHNPRRSAVVNNLARVLRRLGDADAAREQFEAAWAVDSAAYGEDHPHAAELANNVGACLFQSGEVSAAREHFAWALRVCNARYGAEHPHVASLTNNLGYALAGLGDLDRAADHFVRAQATAEATLGNDHPVLAHIRANLGIVRRLQGRHDDAERELERAITLAEAALGRDHTDVARILTYLALLQLDRGNPASARAHLERAIAIDEQAFGPWHAGLIARLGHLATCFKMTGNVDAAVACNERSTAIARRLREQSVDGEPFWAPLGRPASLASA